MNDESIVRADLDGKASCDRSVRASVELAAHHIEEIVKFVPGGATNVQDVYPLSPLQEGMLFHRLLNQQADTYVLSTLFELRAQAHTQELVAALQRVIDRHDSLRSAVLWENLPRPVQVVCRKVVLTVENVALPGEGELRQRLNAWLSPMHQDLDLRNAPPVRLQLAPHPDGTRWYAVLRVHHLVCDHQSLRELIAEVMAHIEGRAASLPNPVSLREGSSQASEAGEAAAKAEEFFRSRLGDIDEPTAPFGLVDVRGDGSRIDEAREQLDPRLVQRIRAQSQKLGVSAARVFHAAWALVVAHTSGRDDVVFGTVLMSGRRTTAEARRALGMFVNTLPLRLQLQDISLTDLIRRTHGELVELRNHHEIPLTSALRCSGLDGSASLFTALLNYRYSLPSAASLQGRDTGVRVLERGEAWTNYPVTMIVDDLGDGFGLISQTNRRVDPRRMIAYLQRALESVVEALEHAPQTPALDLAVVPEDEYRQLIEDFNATETSLPSETLIQQLFESQVARTPHAVAVVCGTSYLSYNELNLRANQLADYLRARGVGPDRLVGLCIERGVHMIVGLLGILKAGGAYLPLDPNYPLERLRAVLEDAAPKVVVTLDRVRDRMPSETPVIVLDAEWDEIARRSRRNTAPHTIGLRSEHLSHVIYTSGSTGRPKGVAIEHRNAVNLIHWARSSMPWETFDRTLLSTSLNFDLSVYECFVPLATGGTLCIVQDALALLREPLDVSLINTVPSAIKAVLDSGHIPSVTRVVNLAGEALKKDLVDRIFAHSDVHYVNNLYGPSETTTYSTWVSMPRETGFDSSIGRPVANTQIYILDSRRRPVAIGVTGEIYIGGAGVARGYLHRPELTAERFLRNPFSSDPQARMYKTGDLGRWRANGTIEYLGRNDHQVKIRGFRIELGEVEARLVGHRQVKEAVVIAREDQPGEKRLVAYFVANDATNAPSVEALRTELKIALPEYMVPSAFVMLERLPLSPNGKLDRRALPAPDLSAYRTREYAAPQGEVEQILAAIWQSLLHVERVGRYDNFFELGGHSLLIVQMLERLHHVSLTVEPRRVFESPSLAQLARALAATDIDSVVVPPNLIRADCTMITPDMLPLVSLGPEHIERIVQAIPGGAANIQDIYPLAPVQEGILFHHLLDGGRGGDTYVLPTLLEISSRERVKELIAAVQAVIDRHDVLRTALLWDHLPAPVQVVCRRATLPVAEIALSPDRDSSEQINEWMKPENQRLDLRFAPPIRLSVAEDPKSGRWYALLQLHHIVIDHATIEIIVSEAVDRLCAREHTSYATAPYREHVARALAYVRSGDADSFFRSKLGDVEDPTAVFGLTNVHGDGRDIQEVCEKLDATLAQRIRAQSRRFAVSAATLFHAAWALITAHTSGRDDVVFGTVFLGRMQGDAQRTLGMFINTLPLRLRLTAISARHLVEYTQRELVALLPREQASLAQAQRCSGIAGSAPLFTSLLNYRHSAPAASADWSAASGIQMLTIQARTNYPLTLSVDDMGDGFAVTALADRRIDAKRILGYVRQTLESLAEALERSSDQPALSLSILPSSERHEVIDRFNDVRRDYGSPKVIQEWFEEQVARAPDVDAIVYEGQSLTYSQLNARANQLAWYLRDKGVCPDRLVGICVERSLEMVVSLFAVLKAGGAYVPLDPVHPRERIAQMIQDSEPVVVLTQARLQERVDAPHGCEIMVLDAKPWEQCAWGAATTRNPDPAQIGLTPAHLAYVIYTSGSTGTPKGVMVEHRNVLHFMHGMEERIHGLEPHCQLIAWNSSFGFDMAGKAWGQLLRGRTVHLLPETIRLSGQELLGFLERHGIEAMECTPSHLRMMRESGFLRDGRARSLRKVLLGGEAIDTETWKELAGAEGTAFFNMYGPTECSVDASCERISGDTPHIGRVMPNARIYLLDAHLQPVPVGVVGEMYIGGTGVARGYLRREELTAERFVADPFSADATARMYKTGDVGRWRADGTIEYLGRNDHQVKIRGFRIELGEIEAQLRRHARVKDAVVVAREDVPGEKRLVAYVVHAPEAAPSVEELRAHVKALMPDYMVPSAIVLLEKLPLTSNGKLDGRALPAPELEAYASRQYEVPQGELEEILAGIWQSLLRVERVGRQDNFFELGGHSLSAMQVIARVQAALPITVAIGALFEFPTLQQFAAHVKERRSASMLDRIVLGDADIDELLERVKSMPESQVQDLLQELTTEDRQ